MTIAFTPLHLGSKAVQPCGRGSGQTAAGLVFAGGYCAPFPDMGLEGVPCRKQSVGPQHPPATLADCSVVGLAGSEALGSVSEEKIDWLAGGVEVPALVERRGFAGDDQPTGADPAAVSVAIDVMEAIIAVTHQASEAHAAKESGKSGANGVALLVLGLGLSESGLCVQGRFVISRCSAHV